MAGYTRNLATFLALLEQLELAQMHMLTYEKFVKYDFSVIRF